MPCQSFSIGGASVILCSPRISDARTTMRNCPTCRARRRFWSIFEEWYGWTETCLTCGDSWQDGERCERPAERGWRAKSVAHAKDHRRQWMAAHPRSSP